ILHLTQPLLSSLRPGPLDGDAILKTDAPHLQLAPPNVTALEDSTTGGERTLRLHITSPRQARIIWVLVENASVMQATLEGRKVQVSEADTRNKFWELFTWDCHQKGLSWIWS